MIKATLDIVTPTFCGRGGTRADTIRIPEIRAAMRAALRMLLVDLVEDAAELHRAESQLFGAAAGGSAGGQGSVRLRPLGALPPVSEPDRADRWLNHQDPAVGRQFRPLAYLAGQGMVTWQGGAFHLNRGFVAPGEQLEVGITGRTAEDEADAALLLRVASGLLGLGARSRRGFGTFEAVIEDGQGPLVADQANRFELMAHFARRFGLLERMQGDAWGSSQPTPSAGLDFSVARRLTGKEAPLGAMAVAGSLLRTARAIEPIQGNPRTNFVTAEHLELTDQFRGAAFGLPATIKVHGMTQIHSGRRASPLWLKPVRAADGQHWDLLAHVPGGDLLPGGAAVLDVGRSTFRIDDTQARQILATFISETPTRTW